ncbi:MAG TPA: ABC transporter ATP-binding protein [Acidobacteriota bacterium]|nr:ABC transporter ATP-binding protein [Acidobacteriota bacterium]
MIETQQLTRRFGDKVALRDLDLKVEPGEILGFLGPNGAGKTTTVKILTGLLEPSSGTARVAGFDVVEQPLEVKKRIGYVPESGALYENLTGGEYLELVGQLHHLDPSGLQRRIDELLGLFGLRGERDQRMTGYSKGMKQKVLIASALLNKPEVLFLDEPLNGIDANAAMIVKELLKKLAGQGKTIFFSSHVLEVVERMCTRIVIINEGRRLVDGTPAEITRSAGAESLEEAFGRLTGSRDIGETASDFLKALEQV